MTELHFKHKLDDAEALLPGQIHLWWTSLAITEEQEKNYRQLLSDQQTEKLNKIQSGSKRQHYVASRGYLQEILAYYLKRMTGELQSSSKSIEIELGEFGKPKIKNNTSDLCFNYSDTNGYGLYAFSLSTELGVDIECLSRTGRFDQIVQRRFSSDEQYLKGAKSADFLKCWTRKEAYGKAIGKGLNYPLREHTMCENLSSNEFSLVNDDYFGQQFSIQLSSQPSARPSVSVSNDDEDQFIACVVSQGKQRKTIKAYDLQSVLFN